MGKNKKFMKVDKAIEPEVKEKTAEILNAPVEFEATEQVHEDFIPPEEDRVKGYVEVADGTTLNIRKAPVVRPNNQIAILGKGVELTVVDPGNPINSEGESWYKVEVNDEPGFAMRKFIRLEKA